MTPNHRMNKKIKEKKMNTVTIFLTAVLLTFALGSISAQSKLKQSKFSVALQGGTFIPMGNASDAYNTGYNAGIELGYLTNKNFEVFINADYNFIGYKSTILTNATPSIFDASVGGRYYFGNNSSNKFFGELGAGLYMFKTSSYSINTTIQVPHIDPETHDTTYTTATSTQTVPSSTASDFGVNAGIGDSYSISKNMAVYIKSNFHMIFTSGSSTTFFGVYGGLRFRF